MEILALIAVALLLLVLIQLTKLRGETNRALSHIRGHTAQLEQLGRDIDSRLRDRFPTSEEEEEERRRVRKEVDPDHAWDA